MEIPYIVGAIIGMGIVILGTLTIGRNLVSFKELLKYCMWGAIGVSVVWIIEGLIKGQFHHGFIADIKWLFLPAFMGAFVGLCVYIKTIQARSIRARYTGNKSMRNTKRKG